MTVIHRVNDEVRVPACQAVAAPEEEYHGFGGGRR